MSEVSVSSKVQSNEPALPLLDRILSLIESGEAIAMFDELVDLYFQENPEVEAPMLRALTLSLQLERGLFTVIPEGPDATNHDMVGTLSYKVDVLLSRAGVIEGARKEILLLKG